MLFNSLNFLIFFPVVCLIYFALPKKIRWAWLLVSSYYFYMSWNAKYAILIFISTLITWISGLLISRFSKISDEKKRIRLKKLSVAFSFIINLAILFFFKYFDFALANFNSFLNLFGVSAISPAFDVILPVGISFYTFQALGYTIDVYRGEVEVERNLFRYMLFVSFFPQLVAGPIERSKNLLNQLRSTPAPFDFDRVKRGLLLMLWGFFQKLVIADRIALFVNPVYNNFRDYGATELALASVLFSIQIYCDFSSYTDIARGGAEVLGFKLMPNFKQPYFSRSIAEFWKNWHISLSTWFRDYLYIPLGGNRCSKARKYLNVMIVFLTSGLWHGANWTFLLWGALHGVYQVVGEITFNFRARVRKLLGIVDNSHSHRFIQRVITFSLVTFGLIFFRANTVKDALEIISKIITDTNLWVLTDKSIFTLGLDESGFFVLFISLAVLFVVSLFHYYNKSIREAILKTNPILRWSTVFIFIFAVLIFGIYGPGYDESQFIYFQF